jgi:quercetin dioxygenase-like cupin family protein
MFSKITLSLGRTAMWAALLATAAIIATSAAMAGQCPADQRKADVRAPNSTPARDVTDNVIGSIDVAKEPAKIPDRLFRLRKLVIKAGGVVPWHSHGNRPAIIYILTGEIVEYASNCAVPIVHRAGDVAVETAGVSHWWQNHGKVTVELLAADLQSDRNDHNM